MVLTFLGHIHQIAFDFGRCLEVVELQGYILPRMRVSVVVGLNDWLRDARPELAEKIKRLFFLLGCDDCVSGCRQLWTR